MACWAGQLRLKCWFYIKSFLCGTEIIISEAIKYVRVQTLWAPKWNVEQAAAKERWARPVKSLVADGQCITGLWAALPQSHTTGRVVELRLPFWKGNCALPRGHSFARGDLVRIQTQMHGKAANSNSPPQGSETPQTLEGVVADVGPELIRVEIEAMGLMEEGAIANQINIARAGKRTWRLDKGFSTVTFERMLAAMSALTRKHSAVMDFILATHPSETPQLDAKLPALPALTIQAARECDASDLNPSQAQALEAMRNNRLTLIQGPRPLTLP